MGRDLISFSLEELVEAQARERGLGRSEGYRDGVAVTAMTLVPAIVLLIYLLVRHQ